MNSEVPLDEPPKTSFAREKDISLADFVYQHLRKNVRAGAYKLGHRLRESDLAKELNVSRTPIREALRRLASDGLVEVANSRGVMFIELDRQQVRELYVLREALEGTAARLAATHASTDEIAMMHDMLQRLSDIEAKPQAIAKLNRSFHQLVHEAAHNRYLAQAIEQLYDSLALLPGTTFAAEGRAAAAHAEHLAILRAIEDRIPDVAEQKARLHIQAAAQIRLRMMFSSE